MYEILVRPIEDLTAGFMDLVADVLGGEAADLRKHAERHESVNLPDDLYAHKDVQTEWWYYTGHCETESGKKFGFELVFFKRRTDLDRLGIIPLRLLANPLYAAHFAVTDIDGRQFRYDHRKSSGGVFDLPVRASEHSYELGLGDWSVTEEDGRHVLQASLGRDLKFTASLKNTKPAILHGNEGIGISHRDEGERSCHFSFTRMSVEGEIIKDLKRESFTGAAWMDREFGTWNQKNWDWLSIQLDGGDELMIYQFRNEDGGAEHFSHGAFIDREGEFTYLKFEEFSVTPTGSWKSEKTGASYPSGWRVKVPRLDCDLLVEPVLRDQELDTRGTTMIVYWEGACGVSGRCRGLDVTGRAYTELVGYDRSHENPSLSSFLFDGSLLRKWLET
jgi:predicted secreted hydrolase